MNLWLIKVRREDGSESVCGGEESYETAVALVDKMQAIWDRLPHRASRDHEVTYYVEEFVPSKFNWPKLIDD